MDAITFITVFGIIMLVVGIAGAVLAGIKNRDVSFWAAWTFLFPPSIVVLVLLARLPGKRPRRPTLDEEDALSDEA